MGSQVEVVKSFLPELLQSMSYEKKREMIENLENNDLGIALHQNVSSGSPAPFERIDKHILVLWEYWKAEMERIESEVPEFKQWRSEYYQVYFVVSDVDRNGEYEFYWTTDRFITWCYYWNAESVWAIPLSDYFDREVILA